MHYFGDMMSDNAETDSTLLTNLTVMPTRKSVMKFALDDEIAQEGSRTEDHNKL